MRQNHSVAQLVEHITFNDGVTGSNPARMTKIFWLSVRLVKVKAVINISKIHIFKDSRYSGDGFSRLLFFYDPIYMVSFGMSVKNSCFTITLF